jgi:hypothetical protein
MGASLPADVPGLNGNCNGAGCFCKPEKLASCCASSHPQQLGPAGGVAGGEVIAAQLPGAVGARGREDHRVAAIAAVEAVDGAHEHLAPRRVGRVEQAVLHIGGRMEVEQDDAGLLVAEAGPPDGVEGR